MGAPLGNCNACKHKTGVHNRTKVPMRLKRIERLEIMYHKKHGTLGSFKTAVRTSNPKLPEYIAKKNRFIRYFNSH